MANAANTFRVATGVNLLWGFDSLFENKRKEDAILIKEGYASNTDAYSIIKRIAENAAQVPPTFQELNRRGELEIVTDTDIINAIRKPWGGQSYFDWLFSCSINLLASGDLFLHPIISVGFTDPVGYRVLQSAVTLIEQTNRGELKGYSYLKGTSRQELFEPEEVIHIKFEDPTLHGIESMRGLSPLQAAYLTLTASTDIEGSGAFLIKNKGAAGLLSDESENRMDPADYTTLQKDLDKRIGGARNFGKVKVSTGKYKFIQLGMSPADLKILESQVLTLRKLCNAYSVSSSIFNDPGNKKFRNYETSNKAMYQDAVLPLWNKIFSGIAGYLDEQGETLKITPDTSEVACLQADKVEEANKNGKITKAILEISKQISENSLSLEGGKVVLTTVWKFSEEEADEILQEINADTNDTSDS